MSIQKPQAMMVERVENAVMEFPSIRPTMQCIGPAGCSRLLLCAKVAPTHRSADCRRWAEAGEYRAQKVPSHRLVN